MSHKLDFSSIVQARNRLAGVIKSAPLERNENLSRKYGCEVYLKREDLQHTRSYKLRGAYNFISSLSAAEKEKGVVCASAGNHAQGVAYTCARLGVKGSIFMPKPTPEQKAVQTKKFGEGSVEIFYEGDTFDDACAKALEFCEKTGGVFVHPFDDERIIAGQGTVGLEIVTDLGSAADMVIAPIGGGGLIAGLAVALQSSSPDTRLIGVEPAGAPSMHAAFEKGEVVELPKIKRFVDGAAVRQAGKIPFAIARERVEKIVIVEEDHICSVIVRLYNDDAIVVEPAGAMSITALELLKDEIRSKTVVCVVSGGNNDFERLQEIKERALIYEGLKHYFIMHLPQRPGALREFLDEVLGPDDDITHFEYTKKSSRERGSVLIGIQLRRREDFEPLLERMAKKDIDHVKVLENPMLRDLLI